MLGWGQGGGREGGPFCVFEQLSSAPSAGASLIALKASQHLNVLDVRDHALIQAL